MVTRVIAVLLAGLVACAAAHAGPKREPVEKRFLWKLALAADGTIETLDPVTRMPPDMREKLEAAIRSWRFRSGRIEGVAMPTQSTLSLHVRAEPEEGDGWIVRLLGASTGPRLHKLDPVYPASAMNAGRVGMVMVRVEHDADGKVVKAELADTSPLKTGNLVGAALDGARRAIYEPERIGDRGVAGVLLQPICFMLNSQPTGRDKKACRLSPGDAELSDDLQPMALGSAVELETDVAGKTL